MRKITETMQVEQHFVEIAVFLLVTPCSDVVR